MAYSTPMDPLSGILSSVRLASSIWSTARLTAPFAVRTRGASSAIFHAVVRGNAFMARNREEPLALGPGALVLLPRGDSHVICDQPGRVPAALGDLSPVDPEDEIPCVEHGGGGDETFLICGTFAMDHAAAETLLALLPPVLHVPSRGKGLVSWFDSTLKLMEHELSEGDPGVDAVLGRLADILFVQILRSSLASLPAEDAGWLAALRDERIGRAIAIIHESPETRLSAELLARQVGMSRSAFFERFSKLVGEPPAQYVTRWRMQTAADLLRRTSLGNAELAERIGYASEDAFGKAFKRFSGATPHEYRTLSAIEPRAQA